MQAVREHHARRADCIIDVAQVCHRAHVHRRLHPQDAAGACISLSLPDGPFKELASLCSSGWRMHYAPGIAALHAVPAQQE